MSGSGVPFQGSAAQTNGGGGTMSGISLSMRSGASDMVTLTGSECGIAKWKLHNSFWSRLGALVGETLASCFLMLDELNSYSEERH